MRNSRLVNAGRRIEEDGRGRAAGRTRTRTEGKGGGA